MNVCLFLKHTADLLNDRLAEAGVTLAGGDGSIAPPRCFVGYPEEINDPSGRGIALLPPEEVRDDGETRTVPVKFVISAPASACRAADVMNAAERIREILVNNPVAGAFALLPEVSWGAVGPERTAENRVAAYVETVYEGPAAFITGVSPRPL